MPRISVIIPVYNGEKTIRETIGSVLNQTFTDFELLVINDGSQDSTLNILADIQDSRLKVFSYANAGVSASRNRGIALARGEFVAFLDADDLWTPDKLEAQLKMLEANPQAILAYSWTEFIDEAGQLLGISERTSMTEDFFTELLQWNCIPGSSSSVFIRKQVFEEIEGFDESLTHGEDWDLWLRLAARFQFLAVTSPQVLCRVTNSSATSNVSLLETGSLKVIERAFARTPKSLHYLKRKSFARLYEYLTLRATYGSLDRQRGLMAVKFLLLAIRYNPSLLRQTSFVLSRIFKVISAILLPRRYFQALRTEVKSLTNGNRDNNLVDPHQNKTGATIGHQISEIVNQQGHIK